MIRAIDARGTGMREDPTPYRVTLRGMAKYSFAIGRPPVDKLRSFIDPWFPEDVKWFELAVVAISKLEDKSHRLEVAEERIRHLTTDCKELNARAWKAFGYVRDVTRRGVSPKLREEILRRDGEECRACGRKDVPMQIDHIHPVSEGGLTVAENLQPLCGPCNASKGRREFEEWLAGREQALSEVQS